jgi:hypothetical protein
LLVFGHDAETTAGYLGRDAKGNQAIVERVALT